MRSNSTESANLRPERALGLRSSALRLIGWIVAQSVIVDAIGRTMEAYATPHNADWAFTLSLLAAVSAIVAPILVTQWMSRARTSTARGRKVPEIHISEHVAKLERALGRAMPRVISKVGTPPRSVWHWERPWRGQYYVFVTNSHSLIYHELAHVMNGDPLMRALVPAPGLLALCAAAASIFATYVAGNVSASEVYNLRPGLRWDAALAGAMLSGTAYLIAKLAHAWEEQAANAVVESLAGLAVSGREVRRKSNQTWFVRTTGTAKRAMARFLNLPVASKTTLIAASGIGIYATERDSWTGIVSTRLELLGSVLDLHTSQILREGRPIDWNVDVVVLFGFLLLNLLQVAASTATSLPVAIWLSVCECRRLTRVASIAMILLAVLGLAFCADSSASERQLVSPATVRAAIDFATACGVVLALGLFRKDASGPFTLLWGTGLALAVESMSQSASWSVRHGHMHTGAVFCLLGGAAIASAIAGVRPRARWMVGWATAAALGINLWGIEFVHAFQYSPDSCPFVGGNRIALAHTNGPEKDGSIYMDPVEAFATQPILSCPSISYGLIQAVMSELREGRGFDPRHGLGVAQVLASRRDPYLLFDTPSLRPSPIVLRAATAGSWSGIGVPALMRGDVLELWNGAVTTCGQQPIILCAGLARLVRNELLLFGDHEGHDKWTAALRSFQTKLRSGATRSKDALPHTLAYLDEIDECHDVEQAHHGPLGLCTRFAQTVELRTSIREAWGLPADCGECSKFDPTSHLDCQYSQVMECERILACMVTNSRKMGPGCGDLEACKNVLEPTISQHALAAIGLREKWWRIDEYRTLRSLAELQGEPGFSEDERLLVSARSTAIQSWSPKFSLPKDNMARQREKYGRNFGWLAEAGLMASAKCHDAEDSTDLLVFVKMLDVFGPYCASSDLLSEDAEQVRRLAARRIEAWQQSGVCAHRVGTATFSLGNGDPRSTICPALRSWARGDAMSRFEKDSKSESGPVGAP